MEFGYVKKRRANEKAAKDHKQAFPLSFLLTDMIFS